MEYFQYKYDNSPEGEEEAIMALKKHLNQYNAIYRKDRDRGGK